MKKVIVMMVALFACSASYAQGEIGKWNLHVQAGVNFNDWGVSESGNDTGLGVNYKDESSLAGGILAGAEIGYRASKLFQPSVGLMYQTANVDVNNTFGSKKETSTVKSSYLAVPILANFYVANGLALKIGVQPAFLLSSKYKTETLEAETKDGMNSVDFQIPLGISYEFPFGLMFDARIYQSVTKVFKKEAKGNLGMNAEEATNQGFMLTVGYKFDL